MFYRACIFSPESIKNRSDIFYPVPERSCVPDSPVWYSTMPITLDVMTKMLTRILLVREIQEAHLHAQPIYVWCMGETVRWIPVGGMIQQMGSTCAHIVSTSYYVSRPELKHSFLVSWWNGPLCSVNHQCWWPVSALQFGLWVNDSSVSYLWMAFWDWRCSGDV